MAVDDRKGDAVTYLDDMTNAYVECALWSELDQSDDSGGLPLDENYTADDIDAESLANMRAECVAFIKDAGELLDGIDADQAGHDFWLTRNGHGAGFWDRGLGGQGEALTERAEVYGEAHLLVTDDGDLQYIG